MIKIKTKQNSSDYITRITITGHFNNEGDIVDSNECKYLSRICFAIYRLYPENVIKIEKGLFILDATICEKHYFQVVVLINFLISYLRLTSYERKINLMEEHT